MRSALSVLYTEMLNINWQLRSNSESYS